MPSLEPFISRQDLTDLLGRDVTEDAGALAAVDAACDICRTLAGQSFNQVIGDTIRLDGAGTDALVLPEFPANAAGTVTVAGGTIADYALDRRNGLLVRTAGTTAEEDTWGYGSWGYDSWGYDSWGHHPFPRSWPLGRQNITVTYDHGYSEEELPRDVRMVALQIASRLVVQGVASQEKIGRDIEVRYGTNATDFTVGERLILNKYRRTR